MYNEYRYKWTLSAVNSMDAALEMLVLGGLVDFAVQCKWVFSIFLNSMMRGEEKQQLEDSRQLILYD